MIAKCSEALALRKAFPADLSGVYGTEEMQQADVTVEPVTVTTATPALPATKGCAPSGVLSRSNDKVFQAGKAAIAKADSITKLQDVTARIEARKGHLSEDQYNSLLQLALEREDALSAPAAEEDPFSDD